MRSGIMFCAFVFGGFLFLNSCAGKADCRAEMNAALIDTLTVSIIPYDPKNLDCERLFPDATNDFLCDEDIEEIEWAIDNILADQNPKEIARFEELSAVDPGEAYRLEDFVLKKQDYHRRYLVVRNQKGEKEVFVAMVCKDLAEKIDFRNTLNQGHGGGSCLFSFKLNLDKKKYYGVWFNTEA